MTERLNKYLALHLGISRREADEHIAKGKVTVNGQPAIIGGRVENGDKVAISGSLVAADTSKQYIALHKPIGYVSSRRQQGEHPTLYELLPKSLQDLKTVGRLDRESSGLILLSNDGDFHYRMTHPKFYKTKIYTATLDKPLAPLHQQMLSDHGIHLDDGPSRLILERNNDDRTEWIVTMTEGRNRQIRRTFAALGYDVVGLHRTAFGSYNIGNLEPGEHQIVDNQLNHSA